MSADGLWQAVQVHEDRLEGRVLLLGDVHAEHEVLAHILGARPADAPALCVGDIADGRGDLDKSIALLREHAVQCVRGNHDRWALAGESRQLPDVSELSAEARTFLSALPATRRYATRLGELLLCHGVGDDDMSVLKPYTQGYALNCIDALARLRMDPALRWVVGGHTHHFMVRPFESFAFLNPGTLRHGVDDAGEPRAPTWAWLDLDANSLERWELEGTRRCRRETIVLPRWPDGTAAGR